MTNRAEDYSSAHQVHVDQYLYKVSSELPLGIAKLWTGQDLIFDLDCDIDL